MKELVDAGYVQTSRKYRTVAAIPEGMTALQALKDADPDQYAKVMERAENWAASDYRMYCAEKDGMALTLTWDEFNEFLVLTGRKPMPLEMIKKRAIDRGTYDPSWDKEKNDADEV